jgi:hypothetical protein
MSRSSFRIRLVISVATAVFAAGTVAAAAGPASAAAAWSVAASPSPAGPSDGSLGRVSCPSSGTCFAVGWYSHSSGNASPLIERWNGIAWAFVSTPKPTGSVAAVLEDVSCTAVASCYAVGYYATSGGVSKSLAERWNGTAWSIGTTPNPAGSTDPIMYGVSCPTSTSCFAVGSYSTSTNTEYKSLVERWNGTNWSIVTSPNPTGSTGTFLSGLACPTTTSCIAVGEYSTGTGYKSLVERWNGTAWSIVTTPNPAGSTDASMSDVSCPTTTNCFAVGSYSTNAEYKSLVERWNGTAWSIVTTPNPSGSLYTYLFGVSCSSSANCFASGYYSTSGGHKSLVERWNGTAWSIVGTPNPTGSTGTNLGGLACPTTTTCFAVGYYTPSAPPEWGGPSAYSLVERWNGTGWFVAAPPAGGSQSELAQVSCPNTTSCFAVGSYVSGSVTKSLVERSNGTTWSIVATPNPTGSTSTTLTGVSCPTTTSCFAVGTYAAASSNSLPVVERWNGTSWSIVTISSPSGSTSTTLTGVSCPTTTSCFAVGYYLTSTGYKSLDERWNGTAWSIVTTPNPAGSTDASMSGVSCPTTTSCFSVGYYDGASIVGFKSLVERWNGTSWSVVTSPNPSGSTVAIMYGVSCPTTTSCIAVGEYSTGTGYKSLVERWNGTAWSIVTTPNPAGSLYPYLFGVSCSSSTSCFAVGQYTTSVANKSLVERWNGTGWSIVTTPNPTGSTFTKLNGVSCPSSTNCYAVSYYDARASEYTLIERYG